MKRIFSVVVCAVGIFFSMTAESKDGCLKSYVSADSLLLYEYYESHIWVSPLNYPRVFSEQRAVAPDWFHYQDRVIELRVLALRKRIWEEYLRDFPLERLSVRVWLMFSLRTGELETVELMFRREVLEDTDSFPIREIIAMCMNFDWSGSTYIMEHEEQKAVAPDWFHYRDRVIELRVLALRKRIREEYPQDYPLGRGSVRVWLMFSLRTGELVTAELMFLKEVLEVVDSFPAREIIAMCMNSDWSGSTYIMEHEPDKYDNMYTGYLFSPY